MEPEAKIDEPAAGSRRSLGAFLARIALVLVSILFVCGSLLTFPAGLPWMILWWLAIAGSFVLSHRSPAWSLLTLAVLIGIKNPEWSMMMLALLAACSIAVVWYFARRGTERQNRWPVVVLLVVWAVFVIDFRRAATQSARTKANHSGAIACLGDSLTDYGYPLELEKLIRNPVLDYGFDGDK